jgi:hypothetical protein
MKANPTKSWKGRIGLVVATLLLLGCGAAGGVKVAVQQDKYSPGFRAADAGRLKGKRIVLASFINQAENTRTWNFYSPDKKLVYETSAPLESFFWDCYRKAFQHAGVRVVDYPAAAAYRGPGPWWYGGPHPAAAAAPKGVAEFQLVLLSVTDQEVRFQALVFKDGTETFRKDYQVTLPPGASQDVKDLEKRAFELVDLTFTTLVRDREFQKAL